MKRALTVLAISHLVALLIAPLMFVAALGWLISEPVVKIADFAFTCDAGRMGGQWVTGCYWSTPW